MSIYIVKEGKIICDECHQVIATVKFDVQDEEILSEHIKVTCLQCIQKTPEEST